MNEKIFKEELTHNLGKLLVIDHLAHEIDGEILTVMI